MLGLLVSLHSESLLALRELQLPVLRVATTTHRELYVDATVAELGLVTYV